MPITLRTAPHDASPWKGHKASNANHLLAQSRPNEYHRSKRLFQSSFDTEDFATAHISGVEHGLVWSIYHAYSTHHHLTLRPDDIWFAILAQLQHFITAHAEELRSFFVPHEGQKKLVVQEEGTIETVDFGNVALRLTELIQENVNDPGLREWILPSFSTTTSCDKVVAAILMMGAMQKYFSYECQLVCGIPSVTLLGERDDWVFLLEKLDPICQLGEEPTQFVALLRPVLQRFVDSFDHPESSDVVDFWGKCAHKSGGSGTHYLSGWVTAFCFWNEDGQSFYGPGPKKEVDLDCFAGNSAGCELDGVYYHRIDSAEVPAGVGSVPLLVRAVLGTEYQTMMVAGLVGIQATDVDSIRPVSGWWMYEKEEEMAEEERQKELKDIYKEFESFGAEIWDECNREKLMELMERQNLSSSFYSVPDAVDRVKRAQSAASALGVPDFVINARSDALLYGGTLDEVITRGKAFLAAGATTVFCLGPMIPPAPGGLSKEQITKLVEAFEGRVNVAPGTFTTKEVAALGVARISVGPGLQFIAIGAIKEAAEQILNV